MTMLKEQKTMLEWDEAYESKVKRIHPFCPNCGHRLSQVMTAMDGPENGSNLYQCEACEQVSLIWFRDEEDWNSHITLKKTKPVILFGLGLVIGVLLAMQVIFWGLV